MDSRARLLKVMLSTHGTEERRPAQYGQPSELVSETEETGSRALFRGNRCQWEGEWQWLIYCRLEFRGESRSHRERERKRESSQPPNRIGKDQGGCSVLFSHHFSFFLFLFLILFVYFVNWLYLNLKLPVPVPLFLIHW